MVLKQIDESKDEQLKILKKLHKITTSEKQKLLIAKDLKSYENGLEAEKQHAYYLNFALENNKNLILLHDIRIEHNGNTAQIDHILISRAGIEVLESKSFKGKLTIKDDGSLSVNYNKKSYSFPNPIEQNNRHIQVLRELLNDYGLESKRQALLGGLEITSKILLSPDTFVVNKKLPNGYERADSFITNRDKEIDNTNILQGLKLISKAFSMDKALDIAEILKMNHKPAEFDYSKKYILPKEKEIKKVEEKPSEVNTDKEKKCPRCNDGILVLRTRKKASTKYNSNEFYGCSNYPKCRYSESP